MPCLQKQPVFCSVLEGLLTDWNWWVV